MVLQRKPRLIGDSNSGGTKICGSCSSAQQLSASVCTQCGYFMSGNQPNRISLAQHRGLVKPTTSTENETISQSQWQEIEKIVRKRCDGFCPICMEGFNQGFEILLSCSHVYHR